MKTNPIFEYQQKIESGEIVACQKVKTVYKALVNELKSGEKWCYDERRAEHAIYFIEHFCCHSKGEWKGKPVKLELWQSALTAAMFGVVDARTGLRRFKEVLLIIAKKNGKSLLASAISLYLLTADGEGGAEIYSAATKREQARIVWQEARNMVKQSPALKKRVKCLVNSMRYDKMFSTYRMLSSDSASEDGLNIYGAVCDEIHAWKTKELYDIIANGISARREPLVLTTTTAGFEREGLYDLKYSLAENILNGYSSGDYRDDSVLPVIYELDSRSEWDNPECWIKANPNLGVSKSREHIEKLVHRAKNEPLELKNLMTKDFNIRETSTEVWLSFEELDNDATFDITEIKPDYAFGGTDLSKTTDLTSACLLFMLPGRNEIFVESMYWLPSELLEKRTREDQIPYETWYEQGLLRLSSGNKVDYDDVIAWYEEMQNDYGIYLYQHRYDSWSSTAFIKGMNNSFGDISVPVIQGKKTLSNPMSQLGNDLRSKRINYNNNSITRWCLTNVRADVDKNGNIQPAKTSNQRRRIDGFAAMLNAYVGMVEEGSDYLRLINK